MRTLFPAFLVMVTAAHAHAYEFRARFVERVGNTDIPLAGNWLDASNFANRRVRIQMGVFDDGNGAAPAGGFVGWNVGAIAVSGPAGSSVNSRSPGRLAPFVFATGVNANGNPPAPAGDPFVSLTDIDATLGTQSPQWNCDANGNPLPQPGATVRGYNTFVSVYEITTRALPVAPYTITFSGNLIAATEWRHVGSAIPPDCGDPADPMDDTPGSITYAPFPTEPVAFSATLNVDIPAPAAASLFAAFGVFVARRRR